MDYKDFKVDESWEHQGVEYYLLAKAEINVVHSRSGDLETSWPVAELGNKVNVWEIEVLAYTSDHEGYATPVIEPRIIASAKEYITKNAQHFAR